MRGLFIILCLVSLGCATSSIDPTPAIQDLMDEQAEAWNSGDIPGFMEGYERSEALLFTSGGKVRRGFKETLEKYQESYAGKSQMGHLTFALLDVRSLGKDAAAVLGSWELTETPKAAGGLFTLVLVQTVEGWRIVHDHTSVKKEEDLPEQE